MTDKFACQDAFSSMADNIIAQDLDLSLSLPFITAAEINHGHPPPLPPPPQSLSLSVASSGDSVTDKPVPATHFQTPNGATTNRSDDRNSATPVVSLLSIDQQQEKDYLSMRGGRRRKSAPPNATCSVPGGPRNPSTFLTNGYTSPATSYAPAGFHPPMYGPFGTNTCNNNFHPLSNGLEYRRTNGFDANRLNRNRPRPRVYEKRPSNDHSSRSSLRTDSNSSASCVDENRNEERPRTTPPPAPYSPMTMPHLKILHNTVSREFHNATRYATNYRSPHQHYHHHNATITTTAMDDKGRPTDFQNSKPTAPNSSNGPTGAAAPSSCSRSISPYFSVSQVHVTTATTQSFAPQARRGGGGGRRSLRRGGAPGASEIGAGDAPLPADDVCKKFETLKL